MSFALELVDRSFASADSPRLRFKPKRWSGNVWGGCEHAEIAVTGDSEALDDMINALRFGVTIRNENGTPVWWGYIHEVQLNVHNTTVTLSLDGLANRVRVGYSYTTGEGEQSGNTVWVEDSLSQLAYGIKERKETAEDSDPTAALEKAKRILAKRKKPTGAPAPAGKRNESSATLTCRGWFDTLDWRYYEQLTGRIVHNPSSTKSALLGWGYTGHVGFSVKDRGIHQVDNNLNGLRAEDRIIITGSTSNNGTFTVDGGNSQDKAHTYTSDTIGFDATDDITDADGGGLGFIEVGELVLVSGSTNTPNNKYHHIDTAGAEQVSTWTSYNGGVLLSPAGPTVTLKQGGHITVEQTVVKEVPGGGGAIVTVKTSTVMLAQRITPTVAGSWFVGEVALTAKRVGAPTDALRVSLYNDAGGNIGSLLETVDYTGTNIQKSDSRVAVTMAGTNTITYGSWYWIIVSRTGANDSVNYYEISLTEDDLAGSLLEYTGTTWQSHTPTAAMLHEVWGVRETTRQIQDIVTASGSMLRGTTVVAHSGIKDRMYRDGERLAIEEIVSLLEAGYSDGRYLFAEVSLERFLRLWPSPSYSSDTALIWRNGELYAQGNAKIPRGALPFGQWMILADFPSTVSHVAQMSPVLLDSVEYNADADQYNWTAYGAEDRNS